MAHGGIESGIIKGINHDSSSILTKTVFSFDATQKFNYPISILRSTFYINEPFLMLILRTRRMLKHNKDICSLEPTR